MSADVRLSRGRVGMTCLIGAESAVFTIFVVAYLFYVGKSLSGPTPAQVLELPLLNTMCLLSSSVTIGIGVAALRGGRLAAFRGWWMATIVLALVFIGGTAREWARLMFDEGLTIRTNLFGTTFYSLVGLHAFHVIAGLACLGVVMALALAGRVEREHAERAEVLAMYWHFVDAAWVVVFSVVYVVGR